MKIKIFPLRNFFRILEAVTRQRFFKCERNELKAICQGRGIDVGCGNSKITESCIGIDMVGKNEIGKYGSQRNKPSKADYKLEGDNLYIFKDNEFDFIVASHNLEHYADPKKTLLEWKRVLKKNGNVGVIVPNNDKVYSMELDPTHKVSFNRDSLIRLFKEAGFQIIKEGHALKNWSLYLIAKKV